MGKMLGGEEEKDPDAAKKEEERQEMLRQQEEERKAKHARMEAEREKVRQTIRDKVEKAVFSNCPVVGPAAFKLDGLYEGRGVNYCAWPLCPLSIQYGLKKKEEKEAEEKAAMEQACEGSLTRPKKAIPRGCGDDEEDEESILDTVLKFLPGPIQDIFKKWKEKTVWIPWSSLVQSGLGQVEGLRKAAIFVGGDWTGRRGLIGLGGGGGGGYHLEDLAKLLEAAHCRSRCSFLLSPSFDLTKLM